MRAELPFTKDVVLVGGGHTHALVLRRWGMNPLPGARLTLIDPSPEAAYSGMLPGYVAGHYDHASLLIDLVRLARFAGARLILGAAGALDPVGGTISVPGRPPIRYDVLSLDIGVTSAMPALPGFADHARPAKPLGPFATAWADFMACGLTGGRRRAVVVGGGVAGLELAMAMAHRLGPGAVTVVEAAPEMLRELAPGTRQAIFDEARRLGLALRPGAAVARVAADHVVLADGDRIASDFTAGAAGATPHAWLATTGLHLTDGAVTVGPTLVSVSHPSVFAAGDCAHLSHAPRPKAGVYAVREAPILFDNLRAALTDQKPRPYRPQRDYLKLISCGSRRAVADRSGLRAAGSLLWRWKDRIDRRFMEQFVTLGPMPAPPMPELAATGAREEAGGQPMCGGCAAKVGRDALAGALAALDPPARGDVVQGAGDDAAVLDIGGQRQVLSTDSLRAFTEDPWLMGRIAAVHALGDVWAMGALPQAALAQIVLPRMSARLQTATLAEILLSAAAVLTEAGADIVGGHSALGREMSVGFSVTGIADGDVIGLAGARQGDALVLVKPLGTGIILAAEMQMAARGAWVAAALESMAESQHAAAAILRGSARAMTDVTGFGLAGHLVGMLEASGCGARLDLGALPVLEGAETLLGRGIRSTLHDANAGLRGRCVMPGGPRAELLFDPQTAGGLMAAVPGEQAGALVAALRDAGYAAARIGQLEAGPPVIAATA